MSSPWRAPARHHSTARLPALHRGRAYESGEEGVPRLHHRFLRSDCRESYQTEGLPEVVDMVEEYTRIIEALNPCVDLFISETLVSEMSADKLFSGRDRHRPPARGGSRDSG